MEYTLNEILFEWESNVEIFFVWLTFACSLHKDNEIYKKLELSIKNQNDLDTLVDLFDGDLSNIENTARKYLMAAVS